MKKLVFTLLAATSLMLTSCFETLEEVTINPDGSGTYSNSNDLSTVVSLMKSMGGKDAEQMEEAKIDTIISLAGLLDSIETLTPEEKLMMMDGKMNMNVDMKAEKVVFTINFPFKSTNEIPKYNRLANKLMNETMKKQLSGPEAGPMGDMPEQSSIDSYYDITYKNDQIKRKLNKDKYIGVGSDEYLVGMKEAAQMGIPITTTQVYKLPRPAKKAEGKNVTLSDDKKTVTVKADLNTFFDTPDQLEFEIEY